MPDGLFITPFALSSPSAACPLYFVQSIITAPPTGHVVPGLFLAVHFRDARSAAECFRTVSRERLRLGTLPPSTTL
jgi:hypothetical protein